VIQKNPSNKPLPPREDGTSAAHAVGDRAREACLYAPPPICAGCAICWRGNIRTGT
jgi:hypothetical protein